MARRFWQRPAVLVYAVAAVSVVGATLTAALLTRPGPGAPPPMATAAPRVPAVDLSTMSPLEAANRLFNRVMSATERGSVEEARQFAPMAVAAYGRVDVLDADARYHLGLLHLVLDDPAAARAQVVSLEQQVPGHLLGLLLAHELAERSGDMKEAARVAAAFAEAYPREIGSPRPEYQAHRATIEEFRAAAGRAAATPAVGTAATPAAGTAAAGADDPDAELFESRCGACHGRDARGSERGPPLVHRTYEPGHHGDAAFVRAVRQGVRSHHWEFGDMPPVAGVSDEEIGRLIAYVRRLQVASGIR